jgi:hypothetical protein
MIKAQVKQPGTVEKAGHMTLEPKDRAALPDRVDAEDFENGAAAPHAVIHQMDLSAVPGDYLAVDPDLSI